MIVFIHGLNTFGDDEIHIGPLRFGAMHAHWERAMKERGLEFLPLTGLAPAEPLAQASQIAARLQVANLPARFHLLGQSTGGLAARALASLPEWRARVASVMTIGTPNLGAQAAEFGLAFSEKFAFLQKLFALFGYDTSRKLDIYRSFTPAAVAALNEKMNAKTPGVTARGFSFLCEVERRALSWPLLTLHDRLNPQNLPGDGFIESTSQAFGEVRGRFSLDHFGELGFFPYLSPSARHRAADEFSRLAEAVAATVREVDEKSTKPQAF